MMCLFRLYFQIQLKLHLFLCLLLEFLQLNRIQFRQLLQTLYAKAT